MASTEFVSAPPPGYNVHISDQSQPAQPQYFPGQPPIPPHYPEVNTVPMIRRAATPRFDFRKILGLILRFVATITTFIGAVVVGSSQQSRALSQMNYFIAVNVIALIYSVATLALSTASFLTRKQQQNQQKQLEIVLKIGDLVIVIFLFSAVGSASATRVYASPSCGYNYNYYAYSHRSSDDPYCDKWIAGIVLSMLGSVAYFVLNLLSIFTVYFS